MKTPDLHIRETLILPAAELHLTASRSGGPGGQHVNKTSTKITLRWNLWESSIPPEWRARLIDALDSRINREGDLVLHADEARSHHRNREIVQARLVDLLREATELAKPRRAPRPRRKLNAVRLADKRLQGIKKALRSRPRPNADPD